MNLQQISDTFEWLLPHIRSFGVNVLICLLLLLIGKKLIRFTVKLIRKVSNQHHVEPTVSRFLESLVRWGLYIIIFFLVFETLGVPSSSILAMFTSAGLAIGLALQGSLSNFAGGVLILLLKPFKVGDYIIEDAGKNEGTVQSIDLFYTHLTTVDNRTVIIPNGTLSNSSLTNATAQTERQLILDFPVAYDTDIRLAKQVIESCINRHEEVIRSENRTVQVIVAALTDSGINLQARLWLPSGSYFAVKCALLEEVKYAFDEASVSIPFPQMDIHVKNQ